MKFGQLLYCGFVAAVSAMPVLADSPRPPSKIAESAVFSGLRERWEAAMKELGVPGMVVVAVKGDKIILLETLGHPDPEGKLPVTADTAFYIASCTKTYTAMGILALAQEGKLGLDDPVKKHLPRMELADSKVTEALSIRELLSHSRGITGGPMVWLDAYTGEINEDRYYHYLKEAPINGRTVYSNVHFTMLGRVIEAVSGERWQDYLDHRLFDPAGMSSTTAYASRMYAGDSAVPCTFVDGRFRATATRKTDRTMHAAGGLGSTANDLARWLILHLNAGHIDGKEIVSKELLAEMLKQQSKLPEPNSPFPGYRRAGFGLGWAMGTLGAEPIFEHGGGYVGTSAWITLMPQRNIGVAAVANADIPLPTAAAIDVYGRLLGETPKDLIPKLREMATRRYADAKERRESRPANPAKVTDGLSLPLESYVGIYSHPMLGTVEVSTSADGLTAKCGDLPMEIGSAGTNKIELLSEHDDPIPGRFIIKEDQVIAVRLKVLDNQDEIVFRR